MGRYVYVVTEVTNIGGRRTTTNKIFKRERKAINYLKKHRSQLVKSMKLVFDHTHGVFFKDFISVAGWFHPDVEGTMTVRQISYERVRCE